MSSGRVTAGISNLGILNTAAGAGEVGGLLLTSLTILFVAERRASFSLVVCAITLSTSIPTFLAAIAFSLLA